MASDQGFWQFLKQQQERLTLVGSLLALGVGVVNSLLDTAHPPIASLAVFSVLVAAYCGSLVVGAVRARAAAPAASRRRAAAVSVGALIVLAAAWGFVFREPIRYSRFLDHIRGGPRVVLSDAVAWQRLRSTGPRGITTTTVAGELGARLSGGPYHLVVMPSRDLDDFRRSARDRILFRGIAESSGLVLKGALLIDQAQAMRFSEDFRTRPSGGAASGPSMPPLRIFGIPSLAQALAPTVPLPVDLAEEHRASVARVLLRHMLGMALYADGDAAAFRMFGDMLDIGAVLPRLENPALANLYLGVGLLFALHNRDYERALRAAALASALAPADGRIRAAHAWLLLASGRAAQADGVLAASGATADESGLTTWLRADYHFAVGEKDLAIGGYEQVLRSEREPDMRTALHFQAAFAYAMSSRLDPQSAGAGIIRHMEDAIQIEGNPVYYAIQGYGWALLGNAPQCDAAFEKARAGASPLPAVTRTNVVIFLSTWRVKSLLKLKQPLLARHEIEALVADPANANNASLLQEFGQSLLDIAGYTGRSEEYQAAEQYFDRVIALQPADGRAHHYKATTLVMRAQNLPDSEEAAKRSLRAQARGEFLQAIRLEHERPVTHEVLAILYEADGDTVNADKHRDRYCELRASELSCVERRAEKSLKAGDIAAAGQAFRTLREAAGPRGAEALLKEGIRWQLAGRLAEAEEAYILALRADPKSSGGHDNLAFVLFDLGRTTEALQHWETALRLEPHADAFAGKAIALAVLGNRQAALAAYRSAVGRDKAYLDCREMQARYFWSDRACQAAQPLIDALAMASRESSRALGTIGRQPTGS